MPYGFVQQKGARVAANDQSSIGTGAFPGSVAAGSTLVAFVTYDVGGIGVTLSGGTAAAWREVDAQPGASQGGHSFVATNVAGGSTAQVVATFSGTVNNPAIHVMEYSGLSAVGIVQAGGKGASASFGESADAIALSSNLIAMRYQPCVVIGFACNRSSASDARLPSAGTGFTSRTAVNPGTGMAVEDKRITSLADTTVTFTSAAGAGTDTYVVLGLALAEAGIVTALPAPRVLGVESFTTSPATLNIPFGCTAAYVFWSHYAGSAGTVATMTLAGAAADQTSALSSSGLANGTGVKAFYDPPAGSQTLAFTWDVTPTEGPVLFAVYVDRNETPWDSAGTNAGGDNTSVGLSPLTASENALILCMEQRYDAYQSVLPDGVTQHAQANNAGEYCKLYSWVAYAEAEFVNASDENYSSIVAVAIPYLAGNYDDIRPMPYYYRTLLST